MNLPSPQEKHGLTRCRDADDTGMITTIFTQTEATSAHQSAHKRWTSQGSGLEIQHSYVKAPDPIPKPTVSPRANTITSQSGNLSWRNGPGTLLRVCRRYLNFIGPGMMLSVAYIDPGNYATDVAAGQTFRFKLLFVVFLSNIFAIFLQALCIHLGTVTGLNLAEMIRKHCPPWLNWTTFVFATAAIIATDMAEIIGTAMGLYMLTNGRLPLVGGCAVSIADTIFFLVLHRDKRGSTNARRAFDLFVGLLVMGVAVCFCIQLAFIRDVTAREVFEGFVPSSGLVKGQGLYQACGILGATVMPHSLYLGSGICQDKLLEYDRKHGLLGDDGDEADEAEGGKYLPSLQAIRSCRWYAIAECGISLFTWALFINSAILVVAGASLYGVSGADNASLFAIYGLLSRTISPAVGKLFAASLLLSGTSAGIVCTLAGQLIAEGQIHWKMAAWKRRLMIRSVSVVPAIIVAGATGMPGVTAALEDSQVALSVILPIVSAPLVYFTCRSRYMSVSEAEGGGQRRTDTPTDAETRTVATTVVNMRVPWYVAVCAVLIWLVITILNVAMLVFTGMGDS